MDSKYQEALNLYNQCDYEEAYSIIIENDLCNTEKGNFLCNECKKQILQQYIYVIKDYIEQGMYGEAIGHRQYYYSQYGRSSELSSIVIPEPIQPAEIDEQPIVGQDEPKELQGKMMVEESSFLKRHLIPLICVVTLLVGLIGYLIYYYNFNEEYIINRKAEELKQDVSKQILLINSENAFYTQSNKDSLYILNLLTDYLEKIPLEIINGKGELEGGIYSLKEAFAANNNEIIFIGDNGANSIFGGDNVLKYDISQGQLKYVCYGREVKHEDGKLILTLLDIINEGASNASHEYFNYDVYCDYDGKVIDGYTIYEDGKIDKYSIRMFFHCLDGNITGWYRYEGHKNYMTIKGKMKGSEFSFIEYDEKGKAFATFSGRANFDKKVLHGVFSRNGKNLHFCTGDPTNVIETISSENMYSLNHFGITMIHPVYFQETNKQNLSENTAIFEYNWNDMILSYVFQLFPSNRKYSNKDVMDAGLKNIQIDEIMSSSYENDGAYCVIFKSGDRIVSCKVLNKEYDSYGIIYFSVPIYKEKLLYMIKANDIISYRID